MVQICSHYLHFTKNFIVSSGEKKEGAKDDPDAKDGAKPDRGDRMRSRDRSRSHLSEKTRRELDVLSFEKIKVSLSAHCFLSFLYEFLYHVLN